ncbi:hypothetical protein [Streptomyces californicus]
MTISDADVRNILQEHRDGGAISRLYTTGKITEHTATAVGVAADHLDLDAQHLEAVRLLHVIDYVREVGERPPVANWLAKLWTRRGARLRHTTGYGAAVIHGDDDRKHGPARHPVVDRVTAALQLLDATTGQSPTDDAYLARW